MIGGKSEWGNKQKVHITELAPVWGIHVPEMVQIFKDMTLHITMAGLNPI